LTLAERAAYAVSKDIAPDRILCLTFTNRAANEMAERIKRNHPASSRKITISTFHALCANILRLEARAIGIPADFVVYDDVDSIGLIEDLARMETRDARDLYYQIEKIKSEAPGTLISSDGLMGSLFETLPDHISSLAIEYQRNLQVRHALDFQDLVAFTRAMLKENEEIRERWMERYDLVQVDEVQDTHLSEYRIVRILAQRSGNLALIGDFDQTIYEWRGSQPQKVIDAFMRDFAPVTTMRLEENYRSTRTLLEAATNFSQSFNPESNGCIPSEGVEVGEPIEVLIEDDEQAEARRIGDVIIGLYEDNPTLQFNRIGVLTRTNRRGAIISQALGQMDIPHVTVEQYEFFRRQEVKDALAHLKIILNPHDLGSLLRVLRRPAKGIGETTIHEVLRDGKEIGLGLTDMIQSQTLSSGEPFGLLIEAMASGSLIIFDVETTGLDVGRDEIVEIAAVKMNAGVISDEFHAFLHPTIPVGDSESVHGYSDVFLGEHGEEPIDVICRFLEWIHTPILVGHNVSFDLSILRSQATRLGLNIPDLRTFDTLDLAHRFLDLKQYRLSDVAKHLGLNQEPNHHAIDDVRATAGVLTALLPVVRRDSRLRRSLVARHGEAFNPLAKLIEGWRKESLTLRPSGLLAKVLSDSGLEDYYSDKGTRQENLEQLQQVFTMRDDPQLHPYAALQEIVKFCALARNIDFLSDTDNRTPIITIHQAQG